MKKIFTLVFVVLFGATIYGQNETYKWALGGGVSVTDFSGPLTKKFFDFDNYKGSGRFFAARYLNPSFNLKLDFTFGKAWFPTITAYPKTVEDVYTLRHIYDVGLALEYKFNNGYIIKENAVFSPYITTGFGFNRIVDYDYNTYVPFGLGFNIRPANWITINLHSSYKLNIDNSYDYTQHSASLVYNLGKKNTSEKSVDNTDSDKDGVPDLTDECPFAAGSTALFGCPDSDMDGIGDSRDNCPNEAGSLANNGCPLLDSDGDGVSDDKDSCPNLKGDPRYAGCPDTDGDGIVDKYDKCPSLAGVASNNGCPAEEEVVTPPVETVTEGPFTGNLVNKTSVFFPNGGSVLSSTAKSKIDNVLNTLNNNPNYRVLIKGYTDASGDDSKNLTLSLKRAQNVWNYMNSKGFDGKKAELFGFGEYHDLNRNPTQDRRVDLEIIR